MPSQTGSIDLTAQVSANNNAKDYSDTVVDNLEIGGRNLLLRTGSDFFSGTGPTLAGGVIRSATTSIVTDEAYPGFEVLKTIRGNTTDTSGRYMYAITNRTTDSALVAGEIYTLSFWAKSETDGLQFIADSIVEHIDRVSESSMILNSEWTRYWFTFKIKEDGSYIRPANCFYTTGPANGVYYVTKLKLEKGNKATDWTPAPEDQEALVTSTRTWYATCDTAAATVAKVATTTDSGFTLHDGVVVDVKFANTNSGAVGSLTLNVNDTGAKSIKTMYNNSLANLTTAGQLYAGLVVRFVYSGTYWIAATNYNSDTYGRTRWQNVIRAIATANSITSGHIICGTESGYRDVAAGVAFDLSYPLLYAGTTISAASGTTDNTYLCINGPNITANGTVQSATQYKTVYLKGSLSGNTFTIAASNFLTCVVPTSADGYVYIPLGMFYNSTTNIYFNSSKELWAYVDGAFGPVSVREASAAAKTATNYITADSSGIKIHMAGNSSTYQHQTSDSTTFYVGGKKRSQVGADGLKVYVGTNETEMASFGTSTRIGKAYVEGATDNESHLELDYRSLRLVDKEGNEFFEIEDLRENNNTAEIVDTFIGDGSTKIFEFSLPASNTSYTVSVSDSSGGNVTKNTRNVTFATAPTSGETITVTYLTTSWLAKAYTLGTRGTGNVGAFSVAEGRDVVASGAFSHAEGDSTAATSFYAHAEGILSSSNNDGAHAEGNHTTAEGLYSHAEGSQSVANGPYSHAEGFNSTAYSYSHSEGDTTEASGIASHAEGYRTKTKHGLSSTPQGAHAEGYRSEAREGGAHAEGIYTLAGERGSHAEGYYSEANALYAHAQNTKTIAGYYSQTTIGKYNDNQSNNAFEIGNGTSDSARSNALVVDWDGNIIAKGMAGMIQMFAGSTAPRGWLICDGSAVSRTSYATLFAAIGTTWGAGDGSTTFNIPDLRGRTPIGAGTGSSLTARTLAAKGGSENIQAHTHAFTQPTVKTELKFQKNVASGSAINRVAGSNLSNPAETSTYTATVTGGAVGAVSGASTGTAGNMPPFAVINFIICTGKTS